VVKPRIALGQFSIGNCSTPCVGYAPNTKSLRQIFFELLRTRHHADDVVDEETFQEHNAPRHIRGPGRIITGRKCWLYCAPLLQVQSRWSEMTDQRNQFWAVRLRYRGFLNHFQHHLVGFLRASHTWAVYFQTIRRNSVQIVYEQNFPIQTYAAFTPNALSKRFPEIDSRNSLSLNRFQNGSVTLLPKANWKRIKSVRHEAA
jgi:hypothetical protein